MDTLKFHCPIELPPALGVDLSNSNTKYNHYRLHHSNGKYKECGRCGHIDTAGALANHDCTGQSLICQHCAKVFRNPACLAGHVKNMHISFECHDCGVTIVGYRKYCRHRMKAHDKMRYECDQCDKKFISNSALKCHMMNVHIRSRPYNCRYGCNMAYNDVSNRNSHEKKKHGGLFQTDPNPNPVLPVAAAAAPAAAQVTLPNLPNAVTVPHPVSVSLPIAAHGPHPSLHLLAAPAPGPARPF